MMTLNRRFLLLIILEQKVMLVLPIHIEFTVTLSNPAGVPVTINYHTSDGTATADEDYSGGC